MTESPVDPRPFCYRCHKPAALCICRRLEVVDNQTAVWILQHLRERFHPIGTARIARLGLAKVEILICPPFTAAPPPGLPAGAALLYPGEGVPPISAELRPAALVVLDGTWSHARKIYRDSPWLQQLPRYGLQVGESRYRIRREPAPTCLSTIEAIVHALQAVEPETPGLSGLLGTFDSMIGDQVALIQRRHAGKRRPQRRRPRSNRAIPRVLVEEPERLVVVYGESAAPPDSRRRRSDRPVREVVQWTAARLGAGEVFERLVTPEMGAPRRAHVLHMGLDPDDAGRVSPAELRRDWRRFLRPDDIVVAHNQYTLDLLRDALDCQRATLSLKAIYCNVRRGRCGTLDEIIAREDLSPPRIAVAGRAAVRLGNALSLLGWLADVSARGVDRAP